MIKKIQYASITVTDIEQAKDFYVNKLGFRLQVENPIPGGNKFVLVTPKEGDASIVFTLPFPNQNHKPGFGTAFITDSVEKTYEELRKQGVAFTKEPAKTPWGGMEAFFVDPFGNTFMLHEA